jgi:hypothetical protein
LENHSRGNTRIYRLLSLIKQEYRIIKCANDINEIEKFFIKPNVMDLIMEEKKR